MKLITEVQIPEYPFHLDHRKDILMMGSCFTENIGRILARYHFPVCINPFGTVFNPLSVKTGLDALMDKDQYHAGDLDQYQGTWFSFDHYTAFSSLDKSECLERINREFILARDALKKASVLVISWGTAWIFTHRESKRVVSNCHRIPSQNFTRSLLTVDEISSAYHGLLGRLIEFNPGLKVLLTVSPVRHWKDGAHGNQVSKASLILASSELVKAFPEQLFYFPSYEIVMDELRDYRFYAGDMLHISEQASLYIWDKFMNRLVSKEARQVTTDLEPYLKLIEHRARENEGEAFRKLEERKEEMRADLCSKYEFLDL